MTSDDLVIEMLADENADLREAVRQLIDLIGDLAFENATLRILYKRELFSRIQGDIRIACLERLRDQQRPAA